MPGIARVGVDVAVGVIAGPGAPSVTVNGSTIAVIGDLVTPHAPWGRPHPPHNFPPMVTASSTVTAEGKAVCRAGDIAACGHASTGSGDVTAD